MSLALQILPSLWTRASSLSVHLTGIVVYAVLSFLIRCLTSLAAVGNWKRELCVCIVRSLEGMSSLNLLDLEESSRERYRCYF